MPFSTGYICKNDKNNKIKETDLQSFVNCFECNTEYQRTAIFKKN